jgi:hypothetical protein
MTKSLKMGHAALVLFALVAALRGAAVGQSPVSKVAEPEELGAVYFHDETGGLIPLEQLKPRAVFFPRRGQDGLREQWLLKGGKSKVRVNSAGKMLFVVRLSSGSDPASFSLLVLKTHGRGRWLQGAPHQRNTRLTVMFDVKKFGDSSYGLTPAEDLAPGEYAFAQNDSKEIYCLGLGDGGEKEHGKNS